MAPFKLGAKKREAEHSYSKSFRGNGEYRYKIYVFRDEVKNEKYKETFNPEEQWMYGESTKLVKFIRVEIFEGRKQSAVKKGLYIMPEDESDTGKILDLIVSYGSNRGMEQEIRVNFERKYLSDLKTVAKKYGYKFEGIDSKYDTRREYAIFEK